MPSFRWDRLSVSPLQCMLCQSGWMSYNRPAVHTLRGAFCNACFSSASTALHFSQVFREADIQALKEAMQLTRQEAIQALKHTAGDVNKAFINELSAFDLRLDIVDDLVRNYAAQRQASLPSGAPNSAGQSPDGDVLHKADAREALTQKHSAFPMAGC